MPSKSKRIEDETPEEDVEEAPMTTKNEEVEPKRSTRRIKDFPQEEEVSRSNAEISDARSEAAHEDQSVHSSRARAKSIAESKSGTTVTSGSGSSGSSEDEAGQEKTLIEKCLSKIPFTMLVAMLMAVPIGFLLIYSILNFTSSISTMRYASAHKEFILQIGKCGYELANERGWTNNVQLFNSTENWERYWLEVGLTNVVCEKATDVAISASDPRISKDWMKQWRLALEELALIRYQSIYGTMGTIETRLKITEVIDVLDEGRSVVAKHPSMASQVGTMMQLKFVWQLAVNIAGGRGCGAEILPLNDTVPWSLIRELGEWRKGFSEYMMQLRQIADGTGSKFLRVWDSNADIQKAVWMMDSLWTDPFLDERWVKATDWFAAFSIAFDTSMGLEEQFFDEIVSAATNLLLIEVAKLIAALIGCIIAAGLILKSNMMTQKRIDKTVNKSKTMQTAVQKFVPRAFLKLCGCTSILHVSAGDETQVATSMLYCDIRNFATVSGHMSNEELFAWLQSYFQRMTGITEGNKGFIDQFIGDSIHSVFSSAADAVRCGIDMHTAVGQLNIKFVSDKGKHLIEVGVGVHYAVVSAGFLGDENRLTVTLISAEVNTAHILERMTPRYGARILVSQQAVDQMGDLSKFECRALGNVMLQGFEKPLGIMDVYQADELAMKNYKSESKTVFEEAIALRSKGKVEKSNMLFERCRTMASAVDMEDCAVNLKLSHNETCDKIIEM